MKHLVILVVFFSYVNLFGQVRSFNDIPKDILNKLDKMGNDDSSLLTSCESEYFNFFFNVNLNGFDFAEKKVGFIYSGAKSNKKEYFALEKDRFNRNNSPNRCILSIFNETQKRESGGYDAAIVYWSKSQIPIQEIVKRLK